MSNTELNFKFNDTEHYIHSKLYPCVYYGLNCVPQKYICWSHFPKYMTIFGEMIFVWAVRLEWGLQGLLSSNMTDVLIRRRTLGTDTDEGRRCCLQGRERGLEQEEPSLLTHSSWTSSCQKYKETNFCFLNYPVCGSLLFQP